MKKVVASNHGKPETPQAAGKANVFLARDLLITAGNIELETSRNPSSEGAKLS